MAPLGDLIIRILLFIFSATAIGLTGAWVHDQSGSNRVRFAVFSAAFSLLFGVIFGILADVIEAIYFPIAMAVVDFLNWVFLFAGATAIAALTGAGSCSNSSNLEHHGFSDSKDCRLAQASSAFLYFAWVCAVGNFVYSVLASLNSGVIGTPSRKRNIPRTGIPTASQV